MATLSPTARLDAVNIGLMLLSCAIAIVIPFELFLFSYAVLGPLHYLTEISWLHDKQYYSKRKYDGYILLAIGLFITLANFGSKLGLDFPSDTTFYLTGVALLGGVLFAFVRSLFVRVAGFLLILLTVYGMVPDPDTQGQSMSWLFLLVFLPTLVHVYVFTGLFMLYGAIKSKSKLGLLSVAVLAACPFILWFILPEYSPVAVTAYGKSAYLGNGIGFSGLNQTVLGRFFGVSPDMSTIRSQEDLNAYWTNAVFHSRTGILLMRFIAFAYTYHYLNWFSKTRVIQWHNVPKARFAGVVALWLLSVAIYAYDYTLGLQWLFFLSFAHVLLEFPLNYVSIAGIGGAIRSAVTGKKPVPVPSRPAPPAKPVGRRGPQRAVAR